MIYLIIIWEGGKLLKMGLYTHMILTIAVMNSF